MLRPGLLPPDPKATPVGRRPGRAHRGPVSCPEATRPEVWTRPGQERPLGSSNRRRRPAQRRKSRGSIGICRVPTLRSPSAALLRNGSRVRSSPILPTARIWRQGFVRVSVDPAMAHRQSTSLTHGALPYARAPACLTSPTLGTGPRSAGSRSSRRVASPGTSPRTTSRSISTRAPSPWRRRARLP